MYIFDDYQQIKFVNIVNDKSKIPKGYRIHIKNDLKEVYVKDGDYDYIYFPTVTSISDVENYLCQKFDQPFLSYQYNKIWNPGFFDKIKRIWLNKFVLIRWYLKRWL